MCSWPLGPSLLSPVILKIEILLAAPALSIYIYKYFLVFVCYDFPKIFVDLSGCFFDIYDLIINYTWKNDEPRIDGKPEEVLNPKKKQLDKITPVCNPH